MRLDAVNTPPDLRIVTLVERLPGMRMMAPNEMYTDANICSSYRTF